jgi:hypothetical protein
MLNLSFVREMFKRYFLVSCSSPGNIILCHGQCLQATGWVDLLYTNTFNGSDNVVWDDGMVSEQWITNVVDRSSCELISYTILTFAWKGWGKVRKTHQDIMLVAEFWVQDPQCKRECWCLVLVYWHEQAEMVEAVWAECVNWKPWPGLIVASFCFLSLCPFKCVSVHVFYYTN